MSGPSSQYDVVIVGARPAGTATAAHLARAGARVLLLDRVTFPRTTLSCPLYFANTLDALRELQALDKTLALGAPRLRLYQTQIGGVRLHGRMLPFNGIDYALQIRRERFDAMLFEHVAGLPGVETRLGFAVTELLRDGGRVTGVRGRAKGGAEEEIRAPLVVGADGVFSTVARAVGAGKYNIVPARTCVYYAYYSNVAPAAAEPSATIYYDPGDHFAFITANSESGLTVVSLSLPAGQFERARSRPEKLHLEYAHKIPEMAERMRGAHRETPVYGVSPRESSYRVPYGPGWVLVGDAGYYKDPLPGQGIHDALRSAALVASAYVAAGGLPASTNPRDTSSRVYNAYQRTRDRETRGMYWLTDYYAQIERDRPAQELDLFRAIAAMPDWSNRYVSLFNGVTDADWFLKPTTSFRILAEWRWRQLRAHLPRAPRSVAGPTNSNRI